MTEILVFWKGNAAASFSRVLLRTFCFLPKHYISSKSFHGTNEVESYSEVFHVSIKTLEELRKLPVTSLIPGKSSLSIFVFLLSILWASNVVSSVVKFWWCGLKLVQFSPLSFLCRVSIMLDITRPVLLQILAQRAIITSSKLFLLKEKVNCTQIIRQRG